MKNMAIAAAVLAGMMASPGPAAAEKWERVGSHVGGGAVEVDRNSLTPWRTQRAWWRISFAEPKRDGTAVEKHFEMIDCVQGISTSLEMVSLASDGSEINHSREAESAALDRLGPPTPGTTGELALDSVCRLRPPPPPPPKAKRK